jgi:TRAP-type C4-dicarboxylate transport system permease small subunit
MRQGMGRRLLVVTEVVAAVFLLLIALLTAANVMLRDFGGPSLPDWYDGSRMLQGIALFWGIALTTYYGSHICVDMLWEYLDQRGRRALDVLATSLTAAFLIPTAWMVWEKVASTGTQGTNDLRLPLVWFYAAAALGMTVAAVLCVARLTLLARGHAPSMADAAALPEHEGRV